MGRVFIFLIGLVIAGLGWAIYDPSILANLGPVAAYAPSPIPLGPLESYRPITAGAVGVVGVLLLLGAITGHRSNHAHRSKSARPQVLVFDDPAPTTPAPTAEPEPVVEAAPESGHEPAPFPVAPIAVVGESPSAPEIGSDPEVELTASQGPAPFADEDAPFPSMPAPEEPESFDAARGRLRDLARDENWSAAAVVLARLPKIAATDAEQALAAQDLGTFHRSQGKTDRAAEAYENALSYARHAEPSDPALLASTLTDVGDVAMEEHRLDVALACYSELLELRRGAVAAEPGPETRRLLSLALERLGDAREERGHRTRALELYHESLAIAGDLAAADPARYGAELALTRGRVSELERRLEG